MYAVFTVVEMLPGTTEDAAVLALKDELLPLIKQAPGFVKGSWFGDAKKGHGLVVFETEEQAQQGVQVIGQIVGGVKVTSSEVYRLHAEA